MTDSQRRRWREGQGDREIERHRGRWTETQRDSGTKRREIERQRDIQTWRD